MNCPIDNKPLVGKQKYCSGACKMKASRNRNMEDQNVTLATVTSPTVTKCVFGEPSCDGDHSKYTSENYPGLKYGPSGSPNPPQVRGSRAFS